MIASEGAVVEPSERSGRSRRSGRRSRRDAIAPGERGRAGPRGRTEHSDSWIDLVSTCQQRAQLAQGPRVQDVGLLQPAPSGLVHAEAQVVEVMDGMGVGVDAHQHSRVLGHPAGEIGEVQPLGVGVELEEATALPRMAEDALQIDLVGFPLEEQPPRGVGEDVKMGVVHGLENARSLPVAGKVESAVDRAHDDVELTQDVVRQVQIAVLQDVHLDPLEQGEPLQFTVQPVDLLDLGQQPFRRRGRVRR